jgi:hypothetical protein
MYHRRKLVDRITSSFIVCEAAARVSELATLVEQGHNSENGTKKKENLLTGKKTHTYSYPHSSILAIFK